MIRLATDRNFDNTILHGLWHRQPDLDIVRVQDVGLSSADDPSILAWAAGQHRVLLTHDFRTMIRYAYDRVDRGLLVPGLVLVPSRHAIGPTVAAILQLVQSSAGGDLEGQVRYLIA